MSGLAFFNLGACRCLLPLTVMAKDDAANATITNTNATDIEESVCVVLAAHLCYGAVAAEPGPRGMY